MLPVISLIILALVLWAVPAQPGAQIRMPKFLFIAICVSLILFGAVKSGWAVQNSSTESLSETSQDRMCEISLRDGVIVIKTTAEQARTMIRYTSNDGTEHIGLMDKVGGTSPQITIGLDPNDQSKNLISCYH